MSYSWPIHHAWSKAHQTLLSTSGFVRLYPFWFRRWRICQSICCSIDRSSLRISFGYLHSSTGIGPSWPCSRHMKAPNASSPASAQQLPIHAAGSTASTSLASAHVSSAHTPFYLFAPISWLSWCRLSLCFLFWCQDHRQDGGFSLPELWFYSMIQLSLFGAQSILLFVL